MPSGSETAGAAATGFSVGGPIGAGIGAGLSLLGGVFGGSGDTTSTQTTTTELGELPPWLAELQRLLMQQGGNLSQMLGNELQNLPGRLSFAELSKNPLAGEMGGISPQIRQGFDQAMKGSFDLASSSLNRGLDLLESRAARAGEAARRTISGQLGAQGLRRSTVGAERLGAVEAGLNENVLNAIMGGQEQLGGLSVANMQMRAQGLLQALGLSQNERAMKLQERGQSIGLRNMADSNIFQLLANPLLAQIFAREAATAKTTTTSTGKAGGGGVASALGGLGGTLFQEAIRTAA